MSLTSPIPSEQGIVHTAVGQNCLVCGQGIHGDPAMFWMGATAEFYLHPACWPDFAAAMFRDYHEFTHPDFYRRLRVSS